jgi:segregation and condensation protein A
VKLRHDPAATPGGGDPSGVPAAVPPDAAVPEDAGAGAVDTAVAAAGPDAGGEGGFRVRLANFEGPFDLLLQLISKHKLDVTEVALHKVTDEFIAYIRNMGQEWDLDEASEFLVVAATLLDLKAARLLPSASVEDEEDLALLEARDLLFARLLQYRAFKQAAGYLAGLEASGGRRWPRAVALEPQYAQALPDLVLGIGPERLAKLAVKAMTPKPVRLVAVDHIHQVRVSVREHAAILRDRIFRAGTASFRALTADCGSTLEVIARFLALLELYREGLVGFTQVQALGELTVRWTGGDTVGGELNVDEYAGSPQEESAAAGTRPDAAGAAEPTAAAGARVVPGGGDDPEPVATPPGDAGSGRGGAGATSGDGAAASGDAGDVEGAR